jgi:N-acetylmuramoyl-L-alanine amidase
MLLSPGDSGPEVAELRRRLKDAGFIAHQLSSNISEPQSFCDATARAVREFQMDRGLSVSGVCDDVCWAALLEASWSLGDRALVLRSPNMRGDDVAELQRILSRLGFDCGRIDGIYGPLGARALSDFQLNVGQDVDGVCHATTVAMLKMLSRMTGDGPGIAAVRDAEEARTGQPLTGRRVVVGQFGDMTNLQESLSSALRDHGALLIDIPETDASAQGHKANLFGADVYVGFEAHPTRQARIAYYSIPSFESAGGRSLAILIERHLRDIVPGLRVEGMRLPILRETKMPAVVLTLGPLEALVPRHERIAEAIFLALIAWTS